MKEVLAILSAITAFAIRQSKASIPLHSGHDFSRILHDSSAWPEFDSTLTGQKFRLRTSEQVWPNALADGNSVNTFKPIAIYAFDRSVHLVFETFRKLSPLFQSARLASQ